MSRLRNDTMREKVAELRARGFSYWEVSQQLHIQPSMVRYYANNIIEKRKNKIQNKKSELSTVAVDIDKMDKNIQ